MILYSISPEIKHKKIEDLIDLPKIVLVNKFTEESAKQFREDFNKALNTGQKIIPILIDSYGGQVYSLFSMMDVIKSSPVPVATVATGKAMSCGSVLLSCGAEGKRYIDPNATVMIHDVSSGNFGKVEEIKADAKETERLNKIFYAILDRNCGKSEGYFTKLVHEKGHADWYLDANECKEHNLANHVRMPNFNVKILSTVEFA